MFTVHNLHNKEIKTFNEHYKINGYITNYVGEVFIQCLNTEQNIYFIINDNINNEYCEHQYTIDKWDDEGYGTPKQSSNVKELSFEEYTEYLSGW